MVSELDMTSIFKVEAVVRPNENGYLMQYVLKEMRAQVKDSFLGNRLFLDFKKLCLQSHGSVSFLSLSPLYLLRDALNRNVLQMNAAEAEQCLRILVWRSEVGIVMFFQISIHRNIYSLNC